MIKVFSNSFNLGVFTSIFSFITCILGFLFAKLIKKEYYNRIIGISTSFTIISLLIMIFQCNMVTIVLFNFFQTVSKTLMSLVNENNQFNLCNDE